MLTDSGGLQEETTALGIPCLTLRENTERPITVDEGTNEVVGTDPATHRRRRARARSTGAASAARCPALWDGQAGERAAEAILARRCAATGRRRHGLTAMRARRAMVPRVPEVVRVRFDRSSANYAGWRLDAYLQQKIRRLVAARGSRLIREPARERRTGAAEAGDASSRPASRSRS